MYTNFQGALCACSSDANSADAAWLWAGSYSSAEHWIMLFRRGHGDGRKMSETRAAVKLRQAPLSLLARNEGQRNWEPECEEKHATLLHKDMDGIANVGLAYPGSAPAVGNDLSETR